MPTAKPFAAMPFPLGAVKPTAGTPLQVISNFSDLTTEAVNSLWVQALVTNTSNVYILGQQAATAADKSGYTNVLFVLQPGQGTPINGKYGNQVWLKYLWIDVDNSGEGVLSCIQEL